MDTDTPTEGPSPVLADSHQVIDNLLNRNRDLTLQVVVLETTLSQSRAQAATLFARAAEAETDLADAQATIERLSTPPKAPKKA